MWRVLSARPNPAFALQVGGMEVINGEYYASERFSNDLQVASCVIFHSLNLSNWKKFLVLSRIPKNMPIVWRGWGFDYYEYLRDSGLSQILPETRSLIKGPEASKSVFDKLRPWKILKAMISRVAGKIIRNRLIARIDYFSCCVPDDFSALKRALPNFKAQFLPLNYYSTEDVFLRGDNLQDLTGHDILLGNSATPTNNHVEAMNILSSLGMQGRKVIVPLSYGDMAYQEKILQAGEKILGESFVPLANFISLPEYNQAVSNCGILIMNSVRQQAMGNISATLIRGGKVFLRPENPTYNHYTRMGVKLFPFSDAMTIADLDAPLSKDDVSTNKEIMSGIWSRAQGIKTAKAISLLGKQMLPKQH